MAWTTIVSSKYVVGSGGGLLTKHMTPVAPQIRVGTWQRPGARCIELCP